MIFNSGSRYRHPDMSVDFYVLVNYGDALQVLWITRDTDLEIGYDEIDHVPNSPKWRLIDEH